MGPSIAFPDKDDLAWAAGPNGHEAIIDWCCMCIPIYALLP